MLYFVLHSLVDIDHSKGRNATPVVFNNLAQRRTGGGLYIDLLEAAALAAGERTSERSVVQTVNRTTSLATLRNSNGKMVEEDHKSI